MNYARLAATCKRLIDKNGRDISLYRTQTGASVPNVDQPWKGKGVAGQAPVYIDEVICRGIFVVPPTSIPTESRGLAFDWINNDLLIQARHVILVPALGLPDLQKHNTFKDNDGKYQSLIWGQMLKPGEVPLLYVFGTQE